MRRLRPGELADLLQELDEDAREEFTASMDLSDLADAIEEMEPDEVEDLMVDTPPEVAAKLIEKMEPDEAVDALRAYLVLAFVVVIVKIVQLAMGH